jgi:hypothetical protein
MRFVFAASLLVSMVGASKNSYLIRAARNSNIPLVSRLLNEGADANAEFNGVSCLSR